MACLVPASCWCDRAPRSGLDGGTSVADVAAETGAASGGRGTDAASGDRETGAPSGTKVVLLGSGTPRADPDRAGPAVAIVVSDRAYLVDCGTGVVRRAAEAHRRGVTALDVRRLSRVFITHLHSDHTLGLADLMLTPWVLGREDPLELVGPPGLSEMVEHIGRAYRQDIEVRARGGEGSDPAAARAVVREVEPGEVYRDELVRVRAFSVRHGSWPVAYGYRFETRDRVIVVSGDTAPARAVVEACDGCDVLVHEVYARAGFDQLPPSGRAYHSSFHTSTRELAELAREARPGLLVLYHQLTWSGRGVPVDEAVLLAEMRDLYDGRVVSGRDLETY
mgnify:CR=1 FL=1